MANSSLSSLMIATLVSKIDYIRDKLGGIEIKCEMVTDWPQDGQQNWGWFVRGLDDNKVAEYNEYYWQPGSGPRETIGEAIDAVYFELVRAIRVTDGKAGSKK